jgi:hypothetical protein
MFSGLVLINFMAIYYDAGRFFVTFADLPAPILPLTELRHLHHKGMEDMRDFLFPGLVWLSGTMLMNLAVAGLALIGYPRNFPK